MKIEEIEVKVKVDTGSFIKQLKAVNKELDKIKGESSEGDPITALLLGVAIGILLSVFIFAIIS